MLISKNKRFHIFFFEHNERVKIKIVLTMESPSDATLGAKDHKHTFWPSDVLIFYPSKKLSFVRKKNYVLS